MAGLLSGAMAGAIGGAGQAVQQNAQGQLEQLRQEALRKVEHKYTMEIQDEQQQFTAGENEQNRGFQAEQKDLDRGQQRELADMRERGADRRTGMQVSAQSARNLVQGHDEQGNPAWFNPTTGQQVSAPDGFQVPRDGPDARGDDWSRQRYEIQWLRDDIEDLEERLDKGDVSGAARLELIDDLDRKRRELGRLRQHSTGRTSAGPSRRGGDDEGGDGPLSLEAFLGR